MNRVIPVSDRALYVTWPDFAGSTFRLLRSGSPQDGFLVIKDLLSYPFYEDDDVNLYNEANKYYYMVQSLDNSGQVIATLPVITARYNRPDSIANKVIYESKVVLRVMRNPPVYLLMKKRTVDHCPECWNFVTHKTKYANCKFCFGTGDIGGYYPPIAIQVSIDVSQLVSANDESDGGLVKLTPINAWMSNSPLTSPEDVLVDTLNRRYTIQRVIPRTRSQYVIRQVLQLVLLEKGHPAYNFYVDLDGGLG